MTWIVCAQKTSVNSNSHSPSSAGSSAGFRFRSVKAGRKTQAELAFAFSDSVPHVHTHCSCESFNDNMLVFASCDNAGVGARQPDCCLPFAPCRSRCCFTCSGLSPVLSFTLKALRTSSTVLVCAFSILTPSRLPLTAGLPLLSSCLPGSLSLVGCVVTGWPPAAGSDYWRLTVS